jgi:hypothetical protein
MCDALNLLDTLLTITGPPIPDRYAPVAYELHQRRYSDLAIHQTVRCLESGLRVEDLAWVNEWDRSAVLEASQRASLLETR